MEILPTSSGYVVIDGEGVAARLKEARLARGLSVREWAELLGNDLTASRVTDVERLKQKPPQGMLLGAVQNAGVSSSWLLTGAGSMLARGRPANAEDAMAVVQAATLKLAGLKLDKKTLREAHKWLVAIELADAKLLHDLATQAAAAADLREPAGLHAGPPDADVLARVLAAVLAAGAHRLPAVDPQVLARVATTLYALAGRGLEVDQAAAASALDLACG